MKLVSQIPLRNGAYSAELHQDGKELFIKIINGPEYIPVDEYFSIMRLTGLLDVLPNLTLHSKYRHMPVNHTSLEPLYEFAGIDPISGDDLGNFVNAVQGVPTYTGQLLAIARHPFYRHLSVSIIHEITGIARNSVWRNYKKICDENDLPRAPYAIMTRRGSIMATKHKNAAEPADSQ